MPQVVIEYSGNLSTLDEQAAVAACVDALMGTGEINEETLKVRAYRAESFQVGTAPLQRGFVAVRIAVLPGRTDEVKRAMSAAVTDALAAAIDTAPQIAVQVTAEVVDIAVATYTKVIVGGEGARPY